MKPRKKRWGRKLAAASLAAAMMVSGNAAGVLAEGSSTKALAEADVGVDKDAYAGYVYVCFADLYPKGTSGEVDVQQVHFFLSRDGLNWTALNGCNAAFQAGETWKQYLDPAAKTDSGRGINWEIKEDFWSPEYREFKAGTLKNSSGNVVEKFNGDETKVSDPVSGKKVKTFQKYYSVMDPEKLKETTTGDASVLFPFEGSDQGIRDPYLLRGARKDGSDADKIWILATDLNTQRAKYNGDFNKPTCGTWDSEAGICGYSSPYMYVYETSDDFKTWTRRYIDLGSVAKLQETNPEIQDSFRMVWAPEAIYNPEKDNYLVYWSAALYSESATAASNRQIYCCETKDFKDFGPVRCYTDEKSNSVTARLADNREKTNLSVWRASIDASQLRVDPNGTYEKGSSYFYRLIKNESNLHCYLESSTDLIDPDILDNSDSFSDKVNPSKKYPLGVPIGNHYETIYQPGLINYKNCEEGPTMFKFIDRDEWCVMVDYYADMSVRYFPLTSTDLSSEQSISKMSEGYSRSNYEDKQRSGKQVQDIGCHGGIIPVTAGEYNSLLEVFNSDPSVTNYHAIDPIKIKEPGNPDDDKDKEKENEQGTEQKDPTPNNGSNTQKPAVTADLKLTAITESLKVGEKKKINVTALPTGTTVQFESSDPAIVKVLSDGQIQGVKAGSAKITIKGSNGKTAVVTVTVKKPKLTISGKKKVKIKKKIQLKAKLTNLVGTVKWSVVSGKKLVKLSKKKGTSIKVTGKKKGTVTIKAVCSGVSKKIKIKVK